MNLQIHDGMTILKVSLVMKLSSPFSKSSYLSLYTPYPIYSIKYIEDKNLKLNKVENLIK